MSKSHSGHRERILCCFISRSEKDFEVHFQKRHTVWPWTRNVEWRPDKVWLWQTIAPVVIELLNCRDFAMLQHFARFVVWHIELVFKEPRITLWAYVRHSSCTVVWGQMLRLEVVLIIMHPCWMNFNVAASGIMLLAVAMFCEPLRVGCWIIAFRAAREATMPPRPHQLLRLLWRT